MPTDSIEPTPVVANGTKKPKSAWLLLVGLVIIIIVVVVVLLIHKNSAAQTGNTCTRPSNRHLLTEAAPLLDSTNITKLKSVVTQIQKLKNYQSDPNCLYPVVDYYVNISDGPHATTYLNELTKVYNANVGYSSYLGTNIQSLQELKQDIAVIEQNAKDNEAGALIPVN